MKLWFKTKGDSPIVCYCHKILLKDIVEIVKNATDQSLTKEKIFKILNLNETNECIKHNPVGESCDKLFANSG